MEQGTSTSVEPDNARRSSTMPVVSTERISDAIHRVSSAPELLDHTSKTEEEFGDAGIGASEEMTMESKERHHKLHDKDKITFKSDEFDHDHEDDSSKKSKKKPRRKFTVLFQLRVIFFGSWFNILLAFVPGSQTLRIRDAEIGS